VTWHGEPVRRWWSVLLLAVVAIAACDGGGGDEAAAATAFEWETVLDQGGDGYALTVEGVVGEGWAEYEMRVSLDGAAVPPDGLGVLAGSTVNGYADGTAGTGPAGIDPEGRTEVRVVGAERWYRNPWLLDEASFALGDAEWVRIPDRGSVIVDAATAVLNERYDAALDRLLAAVAEGTPVEAPTPEESSAELDEVLTPWVGLAGAAYPMGSAATVTGDERKGEATWRDQLTADVDGVDGAQGGTVRWRPASGEAPSPPADAIDVAELTAGLGG